MTKQLRLVSACAALAVALPAWATLDVAQIARIDDAQTSSWYVALIVLFVVVIGIGLLQGVRRLRDEERRDDAERHRLRVVPGK